MIKNIPIKKNLESSITILRKIKNSLKNLIKGGNPKFKIPTKNHHNPNKGIIKIDLLRENKLRVKKR